MAFVAALNAVAAPPTHQEDARPQQQLFTCLACLVAFSTADQQREHYRSDWHRYNLKRKVAELPPLSAEQFVARVQAQQQKQLEDSSRASFVAECTACGKIYSSENAYNNHLASKKHKEAAAKAAKSGSAPTPAPAETTVADATAAVAEPVANAPADTVMTDVANLTSVTSASVDAQTDDINTRIALHDAEFRKRLAAGVSSDDQMRALVEWKMANAPRLEETDCIFCPYRSSSFESNLEHMTRAHSFFIPDLEYIMDIKGLIKYLQEKVAVGNICLFCNGKGRTLHSVEAVRKHMIDKGHCKLLYDEADQDDLAEFYDFSDSWGPHSEDDDWESVGGESDDNDETTTEDMVIIDETGTDSKTQRTTRGAANIAYNDNTAELTLPNGTRIGHRAYNRYWRQHLSLSSPSNNSNSPTTRHGKFILPAPQAANLVQSLVKTYAALGYTPSAAMVEMARNKRRVARAERRKDVAEKARLEFKTAGLVKHFRRQNPI